MNIRGLRSNLVECEYFLESNSTDILALCETKFDDWTGFVNFSVPDYLSLFWKDSVTHISCSLCEGGASFCTGLISRKLCRFLLMFLAGLALLHSVPHFFFLYDHLLCAQFLVQFYLTYIKFSQSTHLQMRL